MARIRTIKPGFFLNEVVSSLPFEWRLLFVGLWTQADRDGRLEDRPQRLKAALFPYDDLNIDHGLGCLANARLITRYEVNGQRLISIPTWSKHQIPHAREDASTLPDINGETSTVGNYPDDRRRAAIYLRDRYRCAYCGRRMEHESDSRARCVDHVVPTSRGGSHNDVNLVTACKMCNGKKGNKLPSEAGMPWPSGLGEYVNGDNVDVNPPLIKGREGKGTGKEGVQDALRARFDRFWAVYPRKQGKDAAWKEWLKRAPSEELTATMIVAVQVQCQSLQWQKDGGQFIPQPRTWLHQGRWQDEVMTGKMNGSKTEIEPSHYATCPHDPKCGSAWECQDLKRSR